MSETFKRQPNAFSDPSPPPYPPRAKSHCELHATKGEGRGVGALSQSGSSGEWGSFIPLGLEHAEKTGYSKSYLDS